MAYRRLLYLQRLSSLLKPRPLITTRYLPHYPILPLMDTPQKRLYSDTTEVSDVKTRIHGLINSNKVVVFMKGDPERPMCGFSRAVVQILQIHGVEFSSVDVLEDISVRHGIKEYTGWLTIPQVFFSGELVGGLDILLKMHQEQELVSELQKIGIQSRLAPEQL